MKENLRRIILFTVIVITGSVMILLDVPLILIVPLIVAAGFVILLLFGAITVADIRSFFTTKNLKNIKKISFIQRLDEMKFFEKKPAPPDNKPVLSPKKKQIPKSVPKKPGAGSQIRSFFTSLGSLRSVLNERSKQAKKVEHIDELLDKAVSEKVKSSALARAGNVADSKISSPGRVSGPGLEEGEEDQDPFLSLSDDEFDISLLDGLDDLETPRSPLSGQVRTPVTPTQESVLTTDEPGIPTPSLNITAEADDLLKENEGSLEEFRGLLGGESIDQDFGDLVKENLDDLGPDVDTKGETPSAEGRSPSQANSPIKTIKADWITSDAPNGAELPEDEISTTSDISSFAGGGSGADADLISSLASDVRHVVKEKNTSLLRDLKDFKAPATEIEKELKETLERMKEGRNSEKKRSRPPRGRNKPENS
jgi:hypothetical protein